MTNHLAFRLHLVGPERTRGVKNVGSLGTDSYRYGSGLVTCGAALS
ncbi:hypothetical protein COLO4_06078 [Corchorus olitorius]|uniref:Uncharacterized protein n=1 Tax=Corchorus olitorius TaxID=93759 RepID=A0A1R3KP21_9ROSI|nr:hypothetical protein COLO4_06078 [Corchorus olitorius]